MKKYFQGCAVNKYVNITSVFTIYEKIFEDTYYFDGESHDFWELIGKSLSADSGVQTAGMTSQKHLD